MFLIIDLMVIFLYRIILSIFLLCKKKYIIDERFYISFFYLSLVGVLVFFTDWLIVGIILVVILPIILTLYVAIAPTRMYWIINGVELTESTYMNKLIEKDSNLLDKNYLQQHFRFSKKKSEKRIKIEFLNMKYEKKESMLKIIVDTIKEHDVKTNKKELIWLLVNIGLILILVILMLIVLFT